MLNNIQFLFSITLQFKSAYRVHGAGRSRADLLETRESKSAGGTAQDSMRMRRLHSSTPGSRIAASTTHIEGSKTQDIRERSNSK